MKPTLVVLTALLLSACTSYGGYRYVERSDGAGDYYYDRYERSDAGYTYYGYPFDVAYGHYPYYYSLFWGFRPYYYDPFFAPGFHYGVTWFPRTWFSFSLGYHDWGYYHAYSPWRYSFWDGYYTWYQAPRRSRPGYAHGVNPVRFGSARNEAERLASMTFQARRGVLTALPSDKSNDFVLGARGRDAGSWSRPVRGSEATREHPAVLGSRAPGAQGITTRAQRDTVAPARRQGPIRGQRPVVPPPARAEDPQARTPSRDSWRAQPRYGSAEVWRPSVVRPQRNDGTGWPVRGTESSGVSASVPRVDTGSIERRPLMLPPHRGPVFGQGGGAVPPSAPTPHPAPARGARGEVLPATPTPSPISASAGRDSVPMVAPHGILRERVAPRSDRHIR